MISNCLLEQGGWKGITFDGKFMFDDVILRCTNTVLQNTMLEGNAHNTCKCCILYEDCQPKPIIVDGRFLGIQIEI